ncbi:MAG: hypothetical protein QXQ76_00970 [Candidatus Bathyarchaeia archaeon]
MAKKAKYWAALIGLSLFLWLCWIPPSIPLHFFGIYLGSVRIGPIALEHEGAGLGLLAFAAWLWLEKRGKGPAPYLIAGLGFLLALSDQRGFYENPPGIALSFLIGLAYAWLLWKIL